MKSKHNKNSQKHKGKKELEWELAKKKEIFRKREIVVNKFYPALIKATVSVDEAKALIQAMSTLLMENVLQTMKERQFADITSSLHTKLCTDGERTKEISELLQTLDGENLFVAREIIEGMTRAISAMETAEMRERSLDTLKTRWDEYLN